MRRIPRTHPPVLLLSLALALGGVAWLAVPSDTVAQQRPNEGLPPPPMDHHGPEGPPGGQEAIQQSTIPRSTALFIGALQVVVLTAAIVLSVVLPTRPLAPDAPGTPGTPAGTQPLDVPDGDRNRPAR